MIETSESPGAPSAWVKRFLPLIRPTGRVLDLAAGSGRHARLLRASGFSVRAVDRDVSALLPLAAGGIEVQQVDLEDGAAWAGGGEYAGVVVTNYLHRPLFPAIVSVLAPGGVLIYETFCCGNERFGRPRNPDFLLRPGELLEACKALSVVAFEQGEVAVPRPAVMQHIAAVNGPLGPLPPAYGVRCGRPEE